MFKSAISKSIAAVAAAATVAGMLALLTSAVPDAKAEPRIEVSAHQPQVNRDRLSPPATGAACSSSHSWPYYDQRCQFDLRQPAHDAPRVAPRVIRVIALR
jgi:hypothetical protein